MSCGVRPAVFLSLFVSVGGVRVMAAQPGAAPGSGMVAGNRLHLYEMAAVVVESWPKGARTRVGWESLTEAFCSEYIGGEDVKREHLTQAGVSMPDYRELLTGHCLGVAETITFNDFRTDGTVQIHVAGDAKAPVEAFDQLVAIRLPNYALNDLRGALSSTRRIGSVDYGAPFRIGLAYRISLPQGYRLKSGPEDKNMTGPAGSSAVHHLRPAEDHIQVDATISFTQAVVPQPLYNDLVRFLDDVSKSLGRDIVLEKT